MIKNLQFHYVYLDNYCLVLFVFFTEPYRFSKDTEIFLNGINKVFYSDTRSPVVIDLADILKKKIKAPNKKQNSTFLSCESKMFKKKSSKEDRMNLQHRQFDYKNDYNHNDALKFSRIESNQRIDKTNI